ncbi:MAG: DEAD/DEAH box helicase family protein [Waddliaceae bacterium]|jgi:ATP-dependent DNA helicase DinG|nr:DEAD/DEAH box helicase family protein [Waddliaceae bacterium]MBT3578855.1 DEAD/DEAH box helicase family protein [Waddliaceae bacterium]MBT6928857.1 DEAD/DEAH box helicase family protein [Waddliaceae bacterium]MBT7264400.1 DEAD/DEAH box helicase family protein [Waddliaceae bacterium]
MKNDKKLSIDEVRRFFKAKGPLHSLFPKFETRKQQQKMAQQVAEAYNDSAIALAEAGTGTGKSLAYLVPAVLWAMKKRKRTVIATHTITLQEQLLNNDIPLVKKLFGDDSFKAVLVKGMSNYLCPRKLDDAIISIDGDTKELNDIASWAAKNSTGDRSDMPFMPSRRSWEKVCAENDACSNIQCPHYKECPFFKARREAHDAQILLVNHHLLFSDLAARGDDPDFTKSAVLPGYQHLIIDEAHTLEDVATEHLASNADKMVLHRLVGKLLPKNNTFKTGGKIALLKRKILQRYKKRDNIEIVAVANKLEHELPAEKGRLLTAVDEVFALVEDFSGFFKAQDEDVEKGQRLRLRKSHQNHAFWKEELLPAVEQLLEEIRSFTQSLEALDASIIGLDDKGLTADTDSVRLDIRAVKARLESVGVVMHTFFFEGLKETTVRWMEVHKKGRYGGNVAIVDADLDISEILAKTFFTKLSSVVLCSATLAANNSFGFIRERLGIIEEKVGTKPVTEAIYGSPFDHKKQVLMAVPKDMPIPSDKNFIAAAAKKAKEIIHLSRGNAFVLFTSYAMMKQCHNHLKEDLEKAGFPVMCQGEDDRKTLLERFRDTNYSVLMGTDSFWEGVDVVGEALRCVIIVKLPFRVPDEPITEARTELIDKNGGNSFFDYAVPSAIVKFKQGFGRLIRNKTDRGCIACLDPRIITKPYGKRFMRSIPECSQVVDAGENFSSTIEDFYRKTYHLTKK